VIADVPRGSSTLNADLTTHSRQKLKAAGPDTVGFLYYSGHGIASGTVTLTDGLGHKYPFAYDTDAKAWRVQYRVPIRTHVDKLGLSVTATSGTNRWKRVWVFLNVEGGVPAESDGR